MEVDLERLIRPGEHNFDSKVEIGEEKVPLDQLSRKPQGEALSRLVSRVQTPFVIALDGPWGSGKSHFLKLWCGSHRKLFGGTGEVVYFNAFAEDYLDDPLMALTRAIAAAVHHDDPKASGKAKKIVKALGRAAVAATWEGTKAMLPGSMGQAASAAAGAALDSLKGASDAVLDALWERELRREGQMKRFREHLAALAQLNERLVIVIDELDRCRPDYALSLLEVVKHVFSEQGMVFVLGADLQALQSSVCKRYGNVPNAGKYLQKFLNLQIHLQAENSDSSRQARDYFNRKMSELGVAENIKEFTLGMLRMTSRNREVTLRDVDRLVSRLAMLPGIESYGEKLAVTATIFCQIFLSEVSRGFESQTEIETAMEKFISMLAPQEEDERRYADYLQKYSSILAGKGAGEDGLRFCREHFGLYPQAVTIGNVVTRHLTGF